MPRKKVEPIAFEELISIAQLAEQFGVTRRTIERYIADGKLPEPRKVFNERFFRRQDIAVWLGDVFAGPALPASSMDGRRQAMGGGVTANDLSIRVARDATAPSGDCSE